MDQHVYAPKKPNIKPIFITQQWTHDIALGYQRRVAADSSFPIKSLIEVLVAACTQFIAEWERRGHEQLLPQFDFVLAGILTAVYGKYAAMWKVSKTTTTSTSTTAAAPAIHSSTHEEDKSEKNSDQQIKETAASSSSSFLQSRQQQKADNTTTAVPTTNRIPTNAFQPFLLDGVTRPTIPQRLQSLILPMGPLFQAGFFASLIGYGFTAIMITIRSWLVPSYIPVTKTVNIVYASLYTGVYMAVSSNLRYQLLQGVIEPAMDACFRKIPILRAAAILSIRTINGLIGSMLAISGMRMLGLFQLR